MSVSIAQENIANAQEFDETTKRVEIQFTRTTRTNYVARVKNQKQEAPIKA